MHAIHRLRFHGRGGEGVKLAGRIVGRSLFLAGFEVQDSPLFGAERRGAPVVSFVRAARAPIRERGYIEAPDVLVVLDVSLLGQPEAAVLDGLTADTLVIANTAKTSHALRERHGIRGPLVVLDAFALAHRTLGQHLPSAPMAGATVKATGLAARERLAEAVRTELADLDVAPARIDANLLAACAAFDAVPVTGCPARPPAAPVAASVACPVPRLPARVAAPSIVAPATSALRSTAGWRVERPVVDRARCSRCVLCFALCPEGAIALDAEDYPVIDEMHCKGCLVCVSVCPPRAIVAVPEPAP